MIRGRMRRLFRPPQCVYSRGVRDWETRTPPELQFDPIKRARGFMNNSIKAIVPVIIGLGLWAIPAPAALDHGGFPLLPI
jgi:hypothetical protein